MVSHLFHDLTAPIQFSTFYLRPGVHIELSTSGTSPRQQLDRLAFWSSDSMVPFVREGFISLYYTSLKLEPEAPDLPLGVAVFEAISRFQNLRSLSCNISSHRSVELAALRVAGLAHLQKLEISGGILSPSTDPAVPFLKTPHFSYGATPARPGSVSGIAMLDPTRMCSLDLAPFHPRGIGDFLGDAGAMAAFRNLRTLRSTFQDTDFTRIHVCIAPFLAVRDLIVCSRMAHNA